MFCPHCCGNRSTSCWKPLSNSTRRCLRHLIGEGSQRRPLTSPGACLRPGDPGNAAAARCRPARCSARQRHGVRGDADCCAESYAEGDDDELADVAFAKRRWPRCGCWPGRRRAVVGACRRGARCWWPRSTGATARPDLDDAVVRLIGPVAHRRCDRRLRRQRRRRACGAARRSSAVDAADLGGRGRRTHRRRRAGPRPRLVWPPGAAVPARAALRTWIRLPLNLRYRRLSLAQELQLAAGLRPVLARYGARPH